MGNSILDPPDVKLAPLHLAYGRAMAKWATIEHWLGKWFAVVTEMPEPMALAVFFSAKNFNGRSEMLESALEHSRAVEGVKQFLRDAIDKAVTYNTFRNTIAHGIPRLRVAGRSTEPVLAQGRGEDLRNAVTATNLDQAGTNFEGLSSILINAYSDFGRRPRHVRQETPLKFAEQVAQLPNEATSATLSRRQIARRRQRRPCTQ